jgi:class 3 adenylate cyclase/tetratricopeptide (TPR) repeat protein
VDKLQQLTEAMAALEAQRGILGDAVVDAALGPMAEKLATLQSQGGEGQQRKFVTVLFADVVGSTYMSQRLDPEEIMAIIDGALRRLTGVIERHGGQVRSYQGDGLMALFGYPVAREDDAERAVRAGLASLQDIAAYAPEVEAGWGYRGFNMRVGINSGEVILGGGVDRDTSALGMATNMAARMQAAAPPGGVLITHDTYRHVRGVFDVQAQPPLYVKGSDEPLQTYVVLQAKPRAFRMATRGVEGVETRMIGREAELAVLQDAYRTAIEGGVTCGVTVVGEAGVGKSRLLAEFGDWIELRPEKVYYMTGRAAPAMQMVPYSLVREMLAFRFEILESDTAAVALAKFRGATAGILEPEKADLVGQLVGFDFSAVSPHVAALLGSDSFGQLGRSYLTQYIRALVAQRPLVTLLEDLHWADDNSLDLVSGLMDDIQSARLLVVGMTRPEFFERRPDWGKGQTPWTRIDLHPLSPDVSRELAAEILQKLPHLPDSLRELIVENAEGNPYYTEELVKMLVDDRVIITGEGDAARAGADNVQGGVWQVDLARLGRVRVPPTLTGILQARLDGLAVEERAVLQRASVVGRMFWDELVADLAADAVGSDAVEGALAAARQHELVFRRERSRFADATEYTFKHTLLRDVTYETVLMRLRRKYHAQVAAWLEVHAAGRLGEYLGIIAGHYEQAGDGPRAAEYLRRLGEDALKVSAYADARDAFTKALELLIGGAPIRALRAALLIDLGEALIRLGDYPAAAVRLDEGLPLARELGDHRAEVAALEALGEIGYRQGKHAAAQAHLAAALALARQHDDRAGMALVTRLLGRAARSRGEYDEATRWATESLSLCRELGDRLAAAAALSLLGVVAGDTGDFDAACRYQTESLAVCQEIGDRMGAARALNNLGVIATGQAAPDRARGYYEQALALHTEIGDRWGASVAVLNIGETYLEEGLDAPAWRYLRRALATSLEIQDLSTCLYILVDMARLLAAGQQPARSAELLALALHHPASDREIGQAAEMALAALTPVLPAAELSAALACGAALDLATVAAEMLLEDDRIAGPLG